MRTQPRLAALFYAVVSDGLEISWQNPPSVWVPSPDDGHRQGVMLDSHLDPRHILMLMRKGTGRRQGTDAEPTTSRRAGGQGSESEPALIV